MKDPQSPSDDGEELRHRAEEVLQKNLAFLKPGQPEKLSPLTLKALMNELHVHQIQLEMQNDELRRIQSDLAASRERYFELYDLAPVGYCTITEKGLIQEANLTDATLFGVDRGILTKQSFTHFVTQADQDIYYQHRKRLAESGLTQDDELRLKKADGSLFWGHLVSNAVNDANEGQTPSGGPTPSKLTRLVIRDVTDRKQAESRLQISEARYLSIIQDQNEFICRYRPDGTLSFVNEAYAAYYQQTVGELIGTAFCRSTLRPFLISS